ncbi:hypothetical protein GE09DRAFT_37510 [Coniochaeta sp. 2T2.1]|nr:hypothetical protein GE09DRAFT_37510 [Coniochaeta sp. 2T2.1]
MTLPEAQPTGSKPTPEEMAKRRRKRHSFQSEKVQSQEWATQFKHRVNGPRAGLGQRNGGPHAGIAVPSVVDSDAGVLPPARCAVGVELRSEAKEETPTSCHFNLLEESLKSHTDNVVQKYIPSHLFCAVRDTMETEFGREMKREESGLLGIVSPQSYWSDVGPDVSSDLMMSMVFFTLVAFFIQLEQDLTLASCQCSDRRNT